MNNVGVVRRGKAAAFYNAATGGGRRGWTAERAAIKSVCIDYVYCAPVSVPVGNAERNSSSEPPALHYSPDWNRRLLLQRGGDRRFAEVAR